MPLTASLVPAGLSLSGNTWHDLVYAVTCCCAKVAAPENTFFLVGTYCVLWTAEQYSRRHKPMSYYRLHAWNTQAISTYGVNQHSSADISAAAYITTCCNPAPDWRDGCVWRADRKKHSLFSYSFMLYEQSKWATSGGEIVNYFCLSRITLFGHMLTSLLFPVLPKSSSWYACTWLLALKNTSVISPEIGVTKSPIYMHLHRNKSGRLDTM